MSVSRTQRVGELMKQEIARLLERGLRDPRIGFVTVTEVRVSKDLRNAKVFVSVYGDESAKESTLEGLRSGKGFMRTELGRRIRLRVVPDLVFILDSSMERRAHIDRLLQEVVDDDSAANEAKPNGSDED